MKKILITGGAGYIGGYLTDLLIKENYDVTVLDNLFFESRYLKEVNFIYGSVSDYELINNVLAQNYDIVICLAAIVGDGACSVNPETTFKINHESILNIANNFENKIIFMSTCSVYGHSDKIIDEEGVKKPLSMYAKSKILAEDALKNRNNKCVFRLGTLFGVGDSFSRIRLDLVVNILTMKAAMGQKLQVYGGEQWRPLLHVRDVAEAILFSIKKDINGTYNISDKNYKIYDIAIEVEKAFEKEGMKIEIVNNLFEDKRNYRVSSDKFKSFGWSPKYSLEYGINQIKMLIKDKRIKNVYDNIYSNANFTSEYFK